MGTTKSIGWVVLSKSTGKSAGRVYASEAKAYAAWRGYMQTNAEVAERYDIVEAFVQC